MPYICGPLTELPLEMQGWVKLFYSRIADVCQEIIGRRPFVPHEHEVKILVQGYAKEKDGEGFVSSAATLILDKGVKVIVDPGMNRVALLESLTKEGLKPEKINFIVLF